MKLLSRLFITLFLILSFAAVSMAAPFKAHLAEFSISGATGRDDLKSVLQGVLASRLNPELLQLVDGRDKAELAISGSYVRFGKMFSLDVQIKELAGNTLTRVFEQGEGEDDLLPAVGRLAGKVDKAVARLAEKRAVAAAPAAVTAAPAVPAATAAVQLSAPKAPVMAVAPRDAYQIRSEEGAVTASGNWTSPAISGNFSALAVGRTLADGRREIFISDERTVRFYLKGAELKQVSEVTVPNPARILSVDTADLDGDGAPELYVTVYDRETLVSRVYLPTDKGLVLKSENLPWFFRGIGQDFRSRTIHTQELVSGGLLSDSVAVLKLSGGKFTAVKPFRLPGSGPVFGFARLDSKGNIVQLNEHGYIVVSSPTGEQLWKSAIKYGGSENHYKVELGDQRRTTSDEYRWTFMEQRMLVTPDGLVLVPHNDGLLNIGNSRSYTRYSIHALQWNGSSMQERWHTKQSQSYLADFAYDAARKELILLEVIQKGDIFGRGRTVISINKVE